MYIYITISFYYNFIILYFNYNRYFIINITYTIYIFKYALQIDLY